MLRQIFVCILFLSLVSGMITEIVRMEKETTKEKKDEARVNVIWTGVLAAVLFAIILYFLFSCTIRKYIKSPDRPSFFVGTVEREMLFGAVKKRINRNR